MADVFKKTYRDRQGRKRKTSKWYGWVRDADGFRKQVPLCRDKAAAQVMLGDLLRKVEHEQAGMVDRHEEHLKTPLRQHLADYKLYLTNQGTTVEYVQLVATRVENILDGIGARYVRDLQPGLVQTYLAERRKPDLEDEDEEGLSIGTCNHYVRAIKAFCTWMVKDGRIPVSPVQILGTKNPQADLRHDRRHLTDEELAKLLAAAEKGPKKLCLTGPERALLYRLTVYTGLRANEVRSLRWQDVDLTGDPPTVTVRAAYSKRRRLDVIPMPAELVRALRAWCREHEAVAEEAIFPNLTEKTADLLKFDLAAAGVAYEDAYGRYADFHSLRHTFVSRLNKAGVNPKVVQDLARHSDIRLTMNRYAHTLLEDQAQAINRLDGLPDPKETEIKAALRTGTDDAGVSSPQLPHPGDVSVRWESLQDKKEVRDEPEEVYREMADSGLKVSPIRPQSTPDFSKRRGGDSNPRISLLTDQRFSKPSLSATQPPLRLSSSCCEIVAYEIIAVSVLRIGRSTPAFYPL